MSLRIYELYKSGDKRAINNHSYVMILGEKYPIRILSIKDDPYFEKNGVSGYCESLDRKIVLCDPASFEGWGDTPIEVIYKSLKETLRHEIIHAFLSESGLKECGASSECWSKDEEIIDWFAVQSPKIYKAFMDCEAL